MKKKLILSLFLGMASLGAMADSPATYPGGEAALQDYLKTNLKYPAAALENGIEGAVEVAFTVKADGSISTIKIVRMVDPDLENEAIRLVKEMPKWNPAEGASGPVDSKATVTVNFEQPD